METLENNTFFIALTSTFKKRYQEVITNCYHLVIPRNGSYDPKQINDKFITVHILKPSPFLKSHFLPYNNKQNFHVQIDQNYIRVTKGFGDQNLTRIKILNEEKAYNSNNKSYSIFICESPLISSLNCKLNYETLQSSSQEIQLVSFEECRNFLNYISPTELNVLRCNITQLLKTYIILPDYIEDVALRLKKLIDLSIDAFSSHYNKHEKYRKNKELLCSTIESYSIGLYYDQLISLIKKKLIHQDRAFVQKAKELKSRNLNPAHFGAQKAFENFIIPRELIEAFSDIDRQVTPFAKVNCMRKTLDSINVCLKRTVDERKSPLDNYRQTIYIMSDDLIAAVICVLIKCEPAFFCSNVEFIHSFSWYLPQNSELGYSLVTFEVAKEYIQNHIDQSRPDPAKGTINQHATASSDQSKNRYSEFSHLDREIDKISKMLENSDIQPKSSFADTKDNNELGGFFGSLADNCLTSSGQKF